VPGGSINVREAKMSGDGKPSRLEELPYRVELWHDGKGDAVERVLARALNVQLARAIFNAAKEEHPARRITLRKGNRIVADTSG
jgi:hypothetical protein